MPRVHFYTVDLADCWILGLCLSREFGRVQAGIALVWIEVGLAFTYKPKWEKLRMEDKDRGR